MDIRDIDHALHEIRQMIIIARRPTERFKASKDPAYLLMPVGEHEPLEFSLGDILDKVVALKEDWATEQPATAAPDAGSDRQPSRSTDRPEPNGRTAYSDIEGPICDAVHMIGMRLSWRMMWRTLTNNFCSP
jgi:hypothetical protein